MNLAGSAQLLWGVGALVLALSALAARRPPAGTVVRSLLAWAAILAVLVLAAVAFGV